MKFLDRLEEWLIASLMAMATILIFLAVVHRYASGLPIPWLQDELIKINTSWAQELCIYMFVWMAKFGAAYGVRVGIHVGVDVLINKLNTPGEINSLFSAYLQVPYLPELSEPWVPNSFGELRTPIRFLLTSKFLCGLCIWRCRLAPT